MDKAMPGRRGPDHPGYRGRLTGLSPQRNIKQTPLPCNVMVCGSAEWLTWTT